MNNPDLNNKLLTIPNIISMIRIALVPVFVILYFSNQFIYATIVLALSGLSDILDGTIARHFNMISSYGKILDPLADKLTQGIAIICISIKHHIVIPLLILLCAKELTMLVASVRLLKKGFRPSESKWWGKLSTVAVFIFLVLMLIADIFENIPYFDVVTFIMAIITAICLLFSLFNYYPIFKEIQSGEYQLDKEKSVKNNNSERNR